MILVAGIDPGKSGGWAVFDRSTRKLLEAGRLDFDNPYLLSRQLAGCEEIIIERAQASNQMGISSSFEYGRSFGRTEAAAMMTGAKIYYVSPSWWKGKLGVPTDKDRAVEHAVLKIPGLSKFIKYKADDGVAEAALIGTVLLSDKLFDQLEVNNERRLAPKKKRTIYKL